ncbi:grpE homolog 1, mitochondrial [Paramuricea clavata]|uniref:GrpE homolog 1, mitochondrial n=1 Tax=Paramuricea clavata TaxID=317549 RepID=A0A6S7GK41_PARCT|nr:grpE homolog 1, mitochondrial [Paramuricea clavata]
MLRPLVGRVFPRRCVYFTGQSLPRMMCTAEKSSNDSTKSEQTVNTEGELSELDQKIKLVEEKDGIINDLEDKYKRALAESENVKNRMKKQVEDTRLFGIQGFAKDLLEVADVLGKATESVPDEEIENNTHLKSLYEGLRLTDQQLHKVFSKNGLEKLSPVGEKFDPNFHEALFEQDIPGKEGTVILVNQVGYTLNARVLRPAKVGVAKAKT